MIEVYGFETPESCRCVLQAKVLSKEEAQVLAEQYRGYGLFPMAWDFEAQEQLEALCQ